MTDLYRVTMRELLPPSIRDDPDAIAASAGIDPDMHLLSADLYREIVFANVDNLDEWVVDRLARDLHIEWYDETLPLSSKRALVRSSLAVHMRKGTPWSVEQVVTDAYSGGSIEEWFEYGGDPYYFRILIVDARVSSKADLDRLIRKVSAVKNVRSWLDYLLLRDNAQARLYVGAAATHREQVRAILPPVEMTPVTVYTASASTEYTHIRAPQEGSV